MYFIRKISKPSSLDKLNSASTFLETEADVLKDEFSTSGNTLSFWRCDDLDHKDHAINAVLLSGNSIESTTFVALSQEQIEKKGIKTDFSEKGKTGYKGFEDLHVNFSELCIAQISDIIDLYKQCSEKNGQIIVMQRSRVKERIRKIISEKLYEPSQTSVHLQEQIAKL